MELSGASALCQQNLAATLKKQSLIETGAYLMCPIHTV